MIVLKLEKTRFRITNALIWQYNRNYATKKEKNVINSNGKIELFGQKYDVDEWTNITPNIINKLDRNLLHTKYHPLNHLANKIKHFFYTNYVSRTGTPFFSVYDNFKPIVTVEQNFDR